MTGPILHLWDKALMQVLPKYYNAESNPQTLYRIKQDMVEVMRHDHNIYISPSDERRIRVKWDGEEQSVNIIIPPNLLAADTLH